MTAVLTPTLEATERAGTSRRTVAQAWLASRGLIALVALLLAVYQGRSLADMVDQWDVEHFTNLALNGYLGRADGTLMAFFPGLPLLLRLGLEVGVPIYLTGVVLSAVCSYLAASALARLGGPVAAVAWLFAPTAVFTVVPYTEALFCAAAFWAWERARADKWAAAAALAALACTVRVSGLFLVGALVVLALTLRTTSATSATSATAGGAGRAGRPGGNEVDGSAGWSCRSRCSARSCSTCTRSPAAGPPGTTPSPPAGRAR